jgi:hypothetical protein
MAEDQATGRKEAGEKCPKRKKAEEYLGIPSSFGVLVMISQEFWGPRNLELVSTPTSAISLQRFIPGVM